MSSNKSLTVVACIFIYVFVKMFEEGKYRNIYLVLVI